MSHVATIAVLVSDDEVGLACLEQACNALGLELRRGQKTYRWYGTWVNDYNSQNAAYRNGRNPKDYGKCDHAIAIKGNNSSYEIGVVRNPNGPGFILEYDFWSGGGGMSKYIEGEGPPGSAGRLVGAYAKARTLALAQVDGYSTSETMVGDECVIEMNDYV